MNNPHDIARMLGLVFAENLHKALVGESLALALRQFRHSLLQVGEKKNESGGGVGGEVGIPYLSIMIRNYENKTAKGQVLHLANSVRTPWQTQSASHKIGAEVASAYLNQVVTHTVKTCKILAPPFG